MPTSPIEDFQSLWRSIETSKTEFNPLDLAIAAFDHVYLGDFVLRTDFFIAGLEITTPPYGFRLFARVSEKLPALTVAPLEYQLTYKDSNGVSHQEFYFINTGSKPVDYEFQLVLLPSTDIVAITNAQIFSGSVPEGIIQFFATRANAETFEQEWFLGGPNLG